MHLCKLSFILDEISYKKSKAVNYKRIKTAHKYKSALFIQRMYRGYVARQKHSEELWQRLTKLRDRRYLFKVMSFIKSVRFFYFAILNSQTNWAKN